MSYAKSVALSFGAAAALSLACRHASAATVPYFESFDGYAAGDTAVTNFTEASTLAWSIASPSYSGKAYEDAMSVFSAGVGIAVGANSSSTIDFPALSSSSFSISTTFRLDVLTLMGSHPQNTATVGLVARSADATPAFTGADRYQVTFFLDDDDAGHATGRLWLKETNLFLGSSVDEISPTALPVALGDVYLLTLSGVASGSTLALSATLTNTVTSGSISVAETDAVNLLSGSNFGYFNNVLVVAGGTVALNADFDDFTAGVPEPATALTSLLACAGLCPRRRAR